ncbi:hypothetical protein K8I61_03745 [bacterium]|nr:hypothetical protein [bacterium]
MRKLLTILVLAGFLAPGAALAETTSKSCKRVLPQPIFEFFGDDRRVADCDDYFFEFVDLDGESREEIIAYQKRFSCTGTRCDAEIFQKRDGRWHNVGTLPGRYVLQDSRTNAFLEIKVGVMGAFVLYTWNGEQYAPLTFADRGRAVSRDAPSFDPWDPLP